MSIISYCLKRMARMQIVCPRLFLCIKLQKETLDFSNTFKFDFIILYGFWPTWVKLLDLFYSGIQSYVLLSPYLCFISFLYLDCMY